MNSSGMKRGLAATAISALAVTGLPFLATSASATPMQNDTNLANADDVLLYAPEVATVGTKNDGTNTTVSLLANGGSNVTAVSFQYDTATSAGDVWVDVPGGPVARGADGAFGLDWSNPPADLEDIRAIGNTGDSDSQAAVLSTTAETVELATEGSLGVFQEPYTDGGTYDATTSELVAVEGTMSDATAPTVEARSHFADTDTDGVGPDEDTDILNPGNDSANKAYDADNNAATPNAFSAILDIDGYPYSTGAEPNQLVIGAEETATDDAEASTLYVQTIGSIEVTPETQDDPTPGDAQVDIVVKDTQGQPVAGAEVYSGGDTDSDGSGPDTDTDGAETLVGYTDGRGEINDVVVGGANAEKYYVNTTDNNAFQEGTDPSDTATVTTYSPTLSEVDIRNDRNRSNFDIDELSDNDDFTIVTKDQKGNPLNEDLAGADVEYRWIIDPSAAGEPTYTTEWRAGETGANGEFDVPGLTDTTDYDSSDVDTLPNNEIPEGTFTLEARRPNVSGTGLTNATPETVKASESDITFAEGAEANAPIEGETTINGTLANDDGGLAGRQVAITYTPGVDSRIAPQAEQPSGVTVNSNTSATVITGEGGAFAIKLEDPAGPPVVADVPETADLNALANGEAAGDATSLQGNLGPNDGTGTSGDPQGDADASNDNRDAEADLAVRWEAQPEVAAIEITTQNLDGDAAPGRPVDFDIIVREKDGVNDNNTGNNPAADDFPVEITVDKGFLSPNAETVNDLELDDDHDQPGDLWGFFESLGQEETVSTGDAGVAGIVGAMERDADFDDDGLATMTVTVKAGDVTETRTIVFDATNVLNLVDGDFERAEGEPMGDVEVPGEVDFQLFAEDQFGNLVGNRTAQISDDSTVADFRTDGDFGATRTDFTTSGPGITAFSDAPATQTLMARITGNESLVGPNETQASDAADTLMVSSDPINWVEAQGPDKVNPSLVVRGRDNGAKPDKIVARSINLTAGAKVTLYKKKNGELKKLREAFMNSKGNHKFIGIKDRNGKKRTKYVVFVEETDQTFRGRGARKVR